MRIRAIRICILCTVTALATGCETTIYRDADGNEILGPDSGCPRAAAAWADVGFENGYCGGRKEVLNKRRLMARYSLACADAGRSVDYAAYLTGVSEGKAFYCTTAGAYWLGRDGRGFKSSRCKDRDILDSWLLSEANSEGRQDTEIEEEIADIYLENFGSYVNSGGIYGSYNRTLPKKAQKRVDKLKSRHDGGSSYPKPRKGCSKY